jgi:uncharacterized repeat protein (TIGR01451 family)
MRHYIKTLTNKFALEQLGLVIAIASALLIVPSAVFAWGPSRATFTQENPADYVTFDSITNNPKYGDERNFFRVRDIDSGQSYGDDETLVAGKKYEALIFYHNNAKSSLNDSGVGIAHDAFARSEMPALVKAGSQDTKAMAYVGASNANPKSVYDDITFKNPTNTDIALRYIPGSAKIASNGAVNGQAISDTALFSSAGTKLGFDSLNGTLPGCDHYSGYITFQFVADQPNFTFVKDVRLNGTKTWADSITAKSGDTVDYRLSYTNTGTTEQKNVVLKDVLPQGLTYVPGSSKLQNANNPNGTAIDDSINAGGVNIGSYAADSNAYLVFSAKVNAATCETITNTAAAETNNGNEQDTAQVTIPGENCAPAATSLPTTGPVEIIAGLLGVGAITLGLAYWWKSRRDLENALHNAQNHSTGITIEHKK